MSERLNRINEMQISPSMMTFKEYYMQFICVNDSNLTNGWGWFVDIELNTEPIRIIQQNRYKMKIPTTIKEIPSIRSMKSMKNLHDASMIFDMDVDDNLKHRTNNNIMICVNLIGVIALGLYYYAIYR